MNKDQSSNQEATVIVDEVLKEIGKEQVAADKQGKQIIEKQVDLEIPSSSKIAEGKDSDIKQRYKQIKEKNEEIKREIYSQFLKENPGKKERLLTAFDYSTNKIIMSFLQPKIADPKTILDYQKTELEVDAESIHELDQIEFHRHTSEMLH